MAMGGSEKRRRLPDWLEWVLVVVVAGVLALLLRTFVVSPYVIPTGSMLETIQEGDQVLGEKVSYYFRTPTQGEIVTFTDPNKPEQTLIKRVIAVGGQTVDLVDGVVYVDGEALDEPYTDGKPSVALNHGPNLEENVTYPYTVPDDCVWVMGDNRTNSADSRYFGAVPLSTVGSHAFVVYWPVADWTTL